MIALKKSFELLNDAPELKGANLDETGDEESENEEIEELGEDTELSEESSEEDC